MRAQFIASSIGSQGGIYPAPTAVYHAGAGFIPPYNHIWLTRAGLLLAALTLVKQEYALVGLLVIGWWLLRVHHEGMALGATLRGGILLIIPLLLAVATNVCYNLLCTGNPINPGYTASAFAAPTLNAEMTGIYGMLASTGKSLFLYSPPLLLLPFAIARFYRRHAWDAALWMATSLLLLLFYARLSFWSGDLAWGPRYIMPLTPLLLLPLGTLLLDFGSWRRSYKLAFGGLLASGVAVQLLSALVSFQAAFFAGFPLGGGLPSHYAAAQFVPAQSPLLKMAALLLEGQISAPAVSHLSSYGLPLFADYLAPAALLSLAVLAGGRLWQLYSVAPLSPDEQAIALPTHHHAITISSPRPYMSQR